MLETVAPVVPVFLREGFLGGVILLCVAFIIGLLVAYNRLQNKYDALYAARINDHDKWNTLLAQIITDSVKADAATANALNSVKEVIQSLKTAFYAMRDEYIKMQAELAKGRRR